MEPSVGFFRSDGHLTARVSGEIDQADAPWLVEEFREQMRGTDTVLEADLSEVTFCGSAGLGVFLQIKTIADRAGTSFALVNPSPIMKAMLAVCGLNEDLTARTEPS